MFRKRARVVVLLLVLVSSFVIKTNAQEITPEKQALIKELLEVRETKKMAEHIANAMFLQMERIYLQMMSQVISEAGILKDKEQKEFQKQLIESRSRFSKRFRELYPRAVTLEQIVINIYFTLYNIEFTEEELRDLIVFYKSPIGEKSTKVMLDWMRQSMQRSSGLLHPKITQLVSEIFQKEKERLLKVQEERQ